MRTHFQKILSCLIVSVLLFSCAGCSGQSDLSADYSTEETASVRKYPGTVNEPVSSDSLWINSNIWGAIDSSLVSDLQDDFQTAVNRDWILNQSLPDDTDEISPFCDSSDLVRDRKIAILSGDGEISSGFESLEEDALRHNMSLVRTFSEAASNWDQRNALGAEPIRRYVRAIENISSLEDLTVFLTDISGDNFTGECFLSLEVESRFIDEKYYRLMINPEDTFILDSPNDYKNIGSVAITAKDAYTKQIIRILSQLGYSSADAESLLRQCFELEGKLVDHNDLILSESHGLTLLQTSRTLQELENLCGNFPVREILRARGMDQAEEYRFSGDGYLSYLSSMYQEANLPLIKSYLIAHCVKAAANLLSREEYELYRSFAGDTDAVSEGTSADSSGKEDEWDLILDDFITRYLAGPMDTLYISRYCSPEQKSQILDMVYNLKDAYRAIIAQEDWLSDSAKEASYRKLDLMGVRAVYPDYFEDYSDILFTADDTLPEMVQKINCHHILDISRWIDRENDRSFWDLDTMPTTTVNACYIPSENTINIFSGILASPLFFDPSSSPEQQLGGIGVIIGHEITHGFDYTGSTYNEYGVQTEFWPSDDRDTFLLRTTKLKNYYSTLYAYPGSELLNGYLLSDEAIADMGGMKMALQVASERTSFDYDLFFRSYAQIWRTQMTYDLAKSYIQVDSHPPEFLRVNVTVMQFEPFYETYGISEQDCMYMAPEQRIAVW